MIMQMTQDLREKMANMQEMFTRNIKELKNKHTEMNNIVGGIKCRENSILEGYVTRET